MYADPARLRQDARTLALAGQDMAAEAGRLVLAADGARWASTAAAGMRRRMHTDAEQLRAVAAAMGRAAAALTRHAAAVEALQSRIAAAERSVERLLHEELSDGAHAASSAVAAVAHGGERLLGALRSLTSRLPASGRVEWLDVPGQLRALGARRVD